METNNTQQIIDKITQANSGKDFVPAPKSVDKEHQAKVKTVWKNIGKIALLVWTILIFARVPFIGSYVDGLFDYLFGFGKYFLYVLSIFCLIGWIFVTGYSQIISTKRFIFVSLLALLSICCIITGVVTMIYNYKDPVPFVTGMKAYHTQWIAYIKEWHYSGFFNHYVTGGIFAELICYAFTILSCVVLIVVAAIVLIICILIIFNINYKTTRIGLKLRGWMVKKLGGTFKYDNYNELKSRRDNQNKFKKKSKAEIEVVAMQNSCLPYDLLPDTDLNKINANFKYVRTKQNRLVKLFRDANIDCVPSDINVYTAYSEIAFEAKNKSQVKEIIKMQPKIAKVAKLDHFNLSIRGNIVNIEMENLFFSKISMKTALNLYDQGKDVTAVFGLNKKSELVIQNFRNNPTALILGKKGSGASTLAVLMALSTCYITPLENMELVILNPNCEATYGYFNNLPHTNGKTYETINACVEKLHNLQNTVNERMSLLKVNNVDNIDQYNKAIDDKQARFKHILVVIGNVDQILRETFQNNKILADIIANGRKAGVYLVMQSYIVNNDIIDKSFYDAITDKYILALGSQEESLKIFDNYRGYQLNGSGDCLHFAATKLNNMSRLQICNISNSELVTDIDLVKTFYATKLKQREEKILAEAKNEENR